MTTINTTKINESEDSDGFQRSQTWVSNVIESARSNQKSPGKFLSASDVSHNLSSKVWEQFRWQEKPKTFNEQFMCDELKETDKLQKYLRSITQDYQLDELFKVESHCYNDQSMNRAAVQVKVNRDLQEFYKGNYLLQVWTDKAELIYQRPLFKPVKAWCMSKHKSTLIFVLDPDDEPDGYHYIHWVELDFNEYRTFKGCDEKQILDWTGQCQDSGLIKEMSFAISDDYLFVSTKQKINAIKIQENKRQREVAFQTETNFSTTDLDFQKQLEDFNDAQNLSKTKSATLHKETVVLAPEEKVKPQNIFEVKDQSEVISWAFDVNEFTLHRLFETNDEEKPEKISICGIFETKKNQNQLDFRKIWITEDKSQEDDQQVRSSKAQFETRQLAEQQKREVELKKNDPIENLQHIKSVDAEGQATICRRRSNQLDLYWNYKLVNSTDKEMDVITDEEQYSHQHTTYTDTALNFDEIKVKQVINSQRKDGKHEPQSDKMFVISLDHDQHIAMRIAEETHDKADFFRNQCLRDYYRPYKTILLFQNFLFVAHGHILSILDTIKMQWLKHQPFGNDNEGLSNSLRRFDSEKNKRIFKVFRHDLQTAADSKKFKIGILFDDSTFKIMKIEQQITSEEVRTSLSFKDLKVDQHPGQIIDVAADLEHSRITYLLTKRNDDSQLHLMAFAESKTFDITEKHEVGKMYADTRLIPFYSPADNSQVILMDLETNDEKSICTIKVLEYQHKVQQFSSKMKKKFKASFSFDNQNQNLLKGIQEDKINFKLALQVRREMNLEETEQFDYKNIHTAISTDMNQNLVLFNKKHAYVFDLASGSNEVETSEESGHECNYTLVTNVIIQKDINVQGLHLIGNMCYVLFNRLSYERINRSLNKGLRSAGANAFGMMNLDMLSQNIKADFQCIPVCEAMVGANNSLDFSDSNQRLVFLEKYTNIVSLPILHHNVMNFNQMRNKNFYLMFKQLDDKLIALDTHNNLVAWSMLTGDQIGQPQKCELDFSGYEVYNPKAKGELLERENDIYRKGHFDYVLFVSKTANADEDAEALKRHDIDFYGPDRLKTFIGSEETHYLRNQKHKYHNFRVCKINDNAKVELLFEFDFPLLSEIEQHIFFSQDLETMLEIQGNQGNCTLYTKESVVGNEKLVKFKLKQTLPRTPINLIDGDMYSLFLLFSPDMRYIIDNDSQNETFCIKDLNNNGENDYEIPKGFLQLPKDESEMILQVKFMAWEEKRKKQTSDQCIEREESEDEQDLELRLIEISANPPIEKVIRIPKARNEHHDLPAQNKSWFERQWDKINGIEPPCLEEKQWTQEVEAISMPYFKREPYIIDPSRPQADPKHPQAEGGNLFRDKLKMKRGDFTSRLMRKHQELKAAWYIGKNDITFDKTLKQPIEQATEVEFRNNILTSMFSIDYTSDPDKILLESPFSFYHWKLIVLIKYYIEEIRALTGKQPEETALCCLSPNTLRDVTLTLLPDLNTVLHNCCFSYEMANYVVSGAMKGDDDFYLPFIPNFKGKTPLHNCLEGNNRETRVADFFLSDILTNSPLDHHGRAIANIVHECINKEVPSFGEYLNNRLITTKRLQKIKVRNMQIKPPQNQEQNTFVAACNMWPDAEQIINRVFEPAESESEVMMQYFDMPYLHNSNRPEADDFAKALANREGDDVELFKLTAIKNLITFRWTQTRMYVIGRLLIPYLVYLAIYLSFSMCVFNEYESLLNSDNTLIVQLFHLMYIVLLVGMSVYFLYNEIWQMHFRANQNYRGSLIGYASHFTAIWNYVDIIPPILIISSIVLDIIDDAQSSRTAELQLSMQAFATFVMWLKVFYFLRIFRQTGFFVNMLHMVILECRFFFLLYVLIHFAFGSAFYILSGGENFFVYVYLLGMGEFDTEFDAYDTPNVALVFFLLMTVIVNIVMLNLLIALVSKAYEEIIETQQEANDLERIRIIEDVNYMVKKDEEYLQFCKHNERMLICQKLSDVQEQEDIDFSDNQQKTLRDILSERLGVKMDEK